MHAGVHQIDRSLHRLGAANALQDGGNRVCMGEHVLACAQHFTCQQRLGKAACPHQGIGLVGDGIGCGSNEIWHRLGYFVLQLRDAGTVASRGW